MTKDGHNEFDLSGSFVRDIIYVFGCLYLFSILGDKFGWLLVSFSFSDENLVGCLYLFQFQAINLDGCLYHFQFPRELLDRIQI